MSIHQLNFHQNFPISIQKAWDFLCSPENLEKITPPYMSFKIQQGFKTGDKMFEGMVIHYTVKPVAGIPLKWISQITLIREPYCFVDQQLSGPYKYWNHKHTLRETSNGVEMTDEIRYEIPLGPLGNLLNSLFIRRQLEGIFSFRKKKLEELFGIFPSSAN